MDASNRARSMGAARAPAAGGQSPNRRRRRLAGCLCGAPLALLCAAARAQECGQVLGVGKRSQFTRVVSAEQVEQAAARQYLQLKQQASTKNALASTSHPQLVRLRAIGERIVPI
ncbi:MAG: M48 family peptidase, partial [Burkholderiales bacterium]|nr:M48 family peptidase [Burkholderiales bacterium]